MTDDRDRDGPKPPGRLRPQLKRRDIFALILATYKAAFPYFLVIVLVLVIVTWLITQVVFTG